jgi:cytochrome c oxidase subunit 2
MAALFLVLLGGAAMAQEPHSPTQDRQYGLPDAASTYSWNVDVLYVVIFWITTAMFLLTEGLLIVFCILYRRRPGHKPTYTHGNMRAEITWTIVPALMLLGIAITQIPTWNHIKKEFPDPGPGVTEIKLFSQQYQWNIMYPGTKSFIEGDTDAATISQMHMPFGNKALVHLRSSDVIHSFFIPAMRVKQDLVPGIRQKVWFEPNRIMLIHVQKGGEHKDPIGPNMDGSDRILQDWTWVSDPKAFDKGGQFASSAIAVDGYILDKDTGRYKPKNEAAKIRILKNGELKKDGKWSECDYCVGLFEIACAELCGLGHYKMRGELHVEPKIAYDAWLKDQADNQLEKVWERKMWKD